MTRRLPAALLCALSISACGSQDPSSPAGPTGDEPQPITGAPYVLYTDIVAGPTSGGENDKGAYLSVFGVNFGSGGLGSSVHVYIGGAEVDNYRRLSPSRGRGDIQQITVQVGALGHATPGAALPISVVVGGATSNTDRTFTPQPGDILFVSTQGNDATAVKNDPGRPWRHVQTPSQGGALAAAQPGDVLVLRGGAGVTWSDVGYDNRWFRFRHITGNAPTGAKGHGYISVMAYPGEDVHYVPPGGTSGGIHGVGYLEDSDWIAISGLHIESVAQSKSDGAPINLQVSSDHWRVVNNELGPWPAPASAENRAGGLAGNGDHLSILGNNIHDIGGGTLNHGIYIDAAAEDVEIAYNMIHDVVAGNLIQTYDSVGEGGMENVAVHHNLLYNGGRYGLNIADGTHSYRAWNNVIDHTALASVRFSVASDSSASFAIVHNTLYDANNAESGLRAPIVSDYDLNRGTAVIKHNIVITRPGTHSTSYFETDGHQDAIKLERNLWYGLGLGVAPPEDSNPVGGNTDRNDPRLVNLAGRDFSLASGSPAIDEATAVLPFAVPDDFRIKARPSGVRSDVGAYEY
jgi:hypothetical protein